MASITRTRNTLGNTRLARGRGPLSRQLFVRVLMVSAALVVTFLSTVTARAASDGDAGVADSTNAGERAAPDGGAGPTTSSKTELTFQLDLEKRAFERAQADVEALEHELESVPTTPDLLSFSAESVQSASAALQKKIVVAAGKPEAAQGNCRAEADALLNALGPIGYARNYFPWGLDGARAIGPTATAQVVLDTRAAVSKLPKKRDGLRLPEFADFGFGVGELPCGSVRPPIALSPEQLTQAFADAQKAAEDRLTSYRAALNAKKSSVEGRRREAERRIATLGAALAELEQKERVDKNAAEKTVSLDIIKQALVSMPIFVVALFAGSFLFASPLQERLFANRTVVELVGLALILMTIIILGTNEKIDRAALGALLGSIAGYIFSQQAQQRAAGDLRRSAPVAPASTIATQSGNADTVGNSSATFTANESVVVGVASPARAAPAAHQVLGTAFGWVTKAARVRFIVSLIVAAVASAVAEQYSGTTATWRSTAIGISISAFGIGAALRGITSGSSRGRFVGALLGFASIVVFAVSRLITEREISVERLTRTAAWFAWGIVIFEFVGGFITREMTKRVGTAKTQPEDGVSPGRTSGAASPAPKTAELSRAERESPGAAPPVEAPASREEGEQGPLEAPAGRPETTDDEDE